MARKLLDSQIRALKPTNKTRMVNDGDGLYIRIRANGTKTWTLRRKVEGKSKLTTLGKYPLLSAKKARIQAALERDRDSKSNLAIPSTTFGELLRKYYRDQIETRYRRPEQVRQYIENRTPSSINSIDMSQSGGAKLSETRLRIREFLKRYARTSGPVAANRLLAIYKQATKFGVIVGDIEIDPLRELSRQYVGGNEKARERVLTDVEIAKLWHAESPHQDLCRFLLLTGQRIGEAQRAKDSHFEDGRWVIPTENSKNGKPHNVPLSRQADSIVESLRAQRHLPFGYSSTTAVQAWMKRWCVRENITPRFTPHDLRRTFVTRLNELGVAPYVVEKLVNHSMQGVMAVYNHATYPEECRNAIQLWNDRLTNICAKR